MATNKKFVIANWKNHPDSLAEAEQLLDFVDEGLSSIKNKELSLVICPPFVFLEEAGKILQSSNLKKYAELGAQDIALADSGAWTGEVSGPMLKRLGVQHVIIGHSERRWKLDETDEMVNQKLKTVLKDKMTPIVCVGEKERNKNYQEFLKSQIKATFAGLSADEIGKCLVAYEPVWAISTNPNAKPDTPEQTLESVAVIKEALGAATRVLYGGSVTQSNAKDFLSLPQISGVLVGGASVRAQEFVEIVKRV